MDKDKEIEILKRKIKREVAARKQAEILLERKAAELYESNSILKKLNADLEGQVKERSETILKDNIRLKTVINSLAGGVLFEDKNRKVTLVNKNFCHFFNIECDPEKLGGVDIEDHIEIIKTKLLYPKRFERYIQKILSWKRPVYNVKLKLKDGITLEGDYVPIFANGEYTGHMWHYRNITKQQRFQMELIAAREAEKTFLSNMSHEIRTPINSIIGMSRLLDGQELTKDQHRYVEGIITSSQHLLGILNHILDFNKIRSGKMTTDNHHFNINDIVSDVVQTVSYLAEEKNISLINEVSSDINPVIFGDSNKLRQVLVNIVGNSIKFTEKGYVKINISLIEKEEGSQTILFEIIDTGIGIKKENHDRIFESFTQAERTITKKFEGTGLGLTISKGFVELMGGHLNVKSTYGKGSMFYFELVLKNGDSSKIQKRFVKIDTELLKGKTILIAEDYPPNRFIAQTLLESWNVNVLLADNGKEAVELLNNHNPDLILMDVQMPVMNGLEATAIIREKGIKTPIIGLSATVVKEIIQAGMKSGMNDYVAKPFEPNELYQKILTNLNYTVVIDNGEMKEEETKANSSDQFYSTSKLLQMVNNDKNFAKHLIDVFIETASTELISISKLKEENDMAEIGKTFHKIKASVRLLAINELAEILNEGEEMAKNDPENPKMEEYIGRATELIEKAISLLKNVVL